MENKQYEFPEFGPDDETEDMPIYEYILLTETPEAMACP